MSKASILKNARNYAEYFRKKARGPVKAFFHITKNENVPAIEQRGLLTNHPNANYVRPGESATDGRYFKFAPGAISRGMGGQSIPPIKERNFNWNTYKQSIAKGEVPSVAATNASPEFVLDWDNTVYKTDHYMPKVTKPADGFGFKTNVGHISAGTPRGYVRDVATGRLLVNPNVQGATQQFYNLGPDDIESLKIYNAYDDIVKDREHPTWQELVRVIMRINAGTSTPYW